MELKIFNPSEDGYLKTIDWNYEELKTEILTKTETYKNLVYSDEQIKEAKEDRANLNKLVMALETKRKDIKNQIMEPYTDFEIKEKDLVAIINTAAANIDTQIKDYEKKLRAEKTEKVRAIYLECVGDLDRILPFEKVFKEQYANASTTIKSIREEITTLVQKVDQDLKIINAESSQYAFEMKEAYLKDFDMNAALLVKQRLEETARKKAEFEARRKQQEEEREAKLKADAEKVAKAGVRESDVSVPTETMVQEDESVENTEQPQSADDTLHTIDFRVQGTVSEINLLKGFLVDNNITFGPVPKNQ